MSQDAAPAIYMDDDADPVADARDLISGQRRLGHPTLLLHCHLGRLWTDAVWCAREARDGDPHAYAALCRINAARRLLRREIEAARDVAAAERRFKKKKAA